jgi:hypothetical protein
MLNFPQDIIPKNKEEREHIDEIELRKRDEFQNTILKDIKYLSNVHTIQKLPLNIFPISQKFSCYSSLPYGIFSTIGQAGCGPLAVEYALRLLGFSVDFQEIISECLEKSYRGYVYNENEEIIDGSGTKYSLFRNIATELTNLDEILLFLEKGCPITLLIQNSVYRDDKNCIGNHFVTLIGIDPNKNAILMDGNKITDNNDPSTALIRKPFDKMILGLRGAWAWEKQKVKNFIV